MNKIVYLIGAGASANALPVVNALPNKMLEMAQHLEERQSEINEEEITDRVTSELSRKKHLLNIISGIKSLAELSSKSASIDTLAKKYFLKGNTKELNDLKLHLSTYFNLEQAKSRTDYRYDAFFASILQRKIRDFPDNLRILSWNYDMQFEYAYSEFTNSMEIMVNQNMLNVAQKNANDNPEINKFGIFKLNGTASLYHKPFRNQVYMANQISHGLNGDILREIIDSYATCITRDDVSPLMSFAWEAESSGGGVIEKAKIAASNPKALVIIGYSFPLFNRGIDKIIFEQMPGLNKVYIQAKEDDALGVKERFLSFWENPASIEVIIRTDVSQFLIPYEL